MSILITVRAREGVEVPLEHNPRARIGGIVLCVEDTPYYRRRIQDGDLLLADGEPALTEESK